MSRDRKIWVAVLIGVVSFVVIGNVVYAALNNRVQIGAWPDVDIGADVVVEYKTTPSRPLHLHLYQPDRQPAPAVVLFHGGGLRQTRIEQFVPQAERFREAGYLVAIAEYRIESEGGTPESSVSDAIDALSWLRTSGGEYGIDASFVAGGGASAGGWLAVQAAHTSAPPDALVLFNPAVNEADAPAAPVPTIVFHSTEDQVVAVGRVEEYCEASVDCEVDLWFTGNHGYFNQSVDEEAFEHTTARTIEHLDRHSRETP